MFRFLFSWVDCEKDGLIGKIKMDKIYIVTQGCYSDYHIVAAFSERRLAEALVEAIGDTGGYDEGRVDEYELDQTLPLLHLWTVRMRWDGSTLGTYNEYVPELDEDGWDIVGPHPLYCSETYLQVKCYAQDKKHAVKIANERRAMLIAEGKRPAGS